jgi:hypothetical protein
MSVQAKIFLLGIDTFVTHLSNWRNQYVMKIGVWWAAEYSFAKMSVHHAYIDTSDVILIALCSWIFFLVLSSSVSIQKVQITVMLLCMLAEYIASGALCRVLLKLWELLVLWSLALIHFCLSFNYQTQFKTGVKGDFVIIGPSLVEDPDGLKLEDKKFILWGENVQCSFCVMLSAVFTVAVRVELLHPQGRQLQECCL